VTLNQCRSSRALLDRCGWMPCCLLVREWTSCKGMDPLFSFDVIDVETSQKGGKRRLMVRAVAISMSAMTADSTGRCAAYHVVYVQDM